MGKIGVIDSGVGGLTVVKELLRVMPKEEVVYFGDTERCPYGNKTSDEVRLFTYQMVNFLLEKEIKSLVIACNTATAVVYEELKQQLSIPVLGVIQPGACAAVQTTKMKRVGVIATTRTIESGAYEKAIRELDSDIEVLNQPCPLLVPLIENGGPIGEKEEQMVAESLKPLMRKEIDTLVLGCTHYPMIAPLIQQKLGPFVRLVDPAQQTVAELYELLKQRGLLETHSASQHLFYVSGETQGFQAKAERWLGFSIRDEKVIL